MSKKKKGYTMVNGPFFMNDNRLGWTRYGPTEKKKLNFIL